ncbi:MAG: MBL fold metallo-hydrolase [Desulfurococcales archaeon]|nr:MBL fold metallo-hydrolase [Desulfurococcales archaeon]
MNNADSLRVKILKTGAIVHGDVSIDGCGKKGLRVVTHAHADHYKGIGSSISYSRRITATPETFAILEGLNIEVPSNKRTPLQIGGSLKWGSLRISFLKAEHIPGTASVVLEDEEGNRIGYTSDFKLEGTDVIDEPDILVIDATYGSPSHVRTWSNADVIDEILALYGRIKGKLWIYGYYGKIQGFLLKLREEGLRDPVIMTSKMYRITHRLSSLDKGFGEFFLYGTKEAKEILKGKPIIFDHATNFYRYRSTRGGVHLLLNGWEFRKPMVEIDKDTYVASYSDHSDYMGTLRYVEESRPKLVVVDASRSEYAAFFAFMARKKLGVNAITLP